MRERDHEFVIIDGIEIDTRMAGLIQALWNLGFKTQFCCENINEGALHRPPAAHIIFPDIKHAMEFVNVTADKMFGHDVGCLDCSERWAEGGLSMHPMMPYGDSGLRWSVEFSPKYIAFITDIWTPKSRKSRA